jgi:hypothetical protein
VSAHSWETLAVASGATSGERQRPLFFASALLIHVGLFQLLVSERRALPETPERRAVLVFLRDTDESRAPREVAPFAPERLPETSPPELTAPQLIAPPEREEAPAPPSVDWQREAEETARDHALRAEAQRQHKNEHAPPKSKPEFGWSHSRVQRIEPMEEGGFLVWINDRCAIVISVLAMPICKIGKKPARDDLFEHMDEAPAMGDWQDE